MAEKGPAREHWSGKLGVILAVAGSAVGLGNFLRFPGRAAMYGGGAFLIPYFTALLLLGIPIAWAEWTMGRYGGLRGVNEVPGIFGAVWRDGRARYFGVISLLVTTIVYMYYIYIEAWCIAYAGFYLAGILPLDSPLGAGRYSSFFNSFVGALGNGAAFGAGHFGIVWWLLAVSAINFWIVYRGIRGGIEKFVSWAMPTLIVISLIILVRVLTLGTPDPALPGQNVWNGLGFMWNPRPMEPGAGLFSALSNPQAWLEAAGQVFFTLSVGFGVIMCYASYIKKDDDVVLSSLTACATNELCEVVFGGLITLPAAFIFLGAAPLAGVLGSSLGLGFHVLPRIFEAMPAGRLFGFLWFFLLFLAAITSSISMLLPVRNFLEGYSGMSRRKGLALLALLTLAGNFIVVYFSGNLVALDTMDFWVGSVLIFVLAMVMVFGFGWVFPLKRGIEEANKGSDFRLPGIFGFIIRYVTPVYMVVVFTAWMWKSVPGYSKTFTQLPVIATLSFVALVAILFLALVWRGNMRRGRAVPPS